MGFMMTKSSTYAHSQRRGVLAAWGSLAALVISATIVLGSGTAAPVSPGRMVTVLAHLTAPGIGLQDGFGSAGTAISGREVLVGAPFEDRAGRAYVFTRNTHGWTVEELSGSGTVAGDQFGQSVAVSGTTAVVLAPSHHNGVAYVFSQTASGWHQVAELEGRSSEARYHFVSIAISGSTIVIGAWEDAGEAVHADVFSKTTAGWKSQGELQGPTLATSACLYKPSCLVPGTEYATLLTSVAISGGTIVVGTHSQSGATVFSRTPSGWRQSAVLHATGVPDHGYSVAVSGRTIVLDSLPGVRGQQVNSYVFTQASANTRGGWREVAGLPSFDGHLRLQFGGQGAFVATSGTTIVETGMGRNGPLMTFIYTESSNSWEIASAYRIGIDWTHLHFPTSWVEDTFGLMPAIFGSIVVLGAPKSVYVLHV